MKIFIKYTTALTLAIFTLIVIGGVSMNMPKSHAGHSPSCMMIMQGETVCTMNPLQHIGAWKRMTTAITPFILLIVAPFLAIIYRFLPAWSIIRIQSAKLTDESRRRSQQNDILKLFDYLLQAFSSGLLHPKIYQV